MTELINVPFNEADAHTFYGILGHHQNEYTELRALDEATKEIVPGGQVFVQSESAFIEFCRTHSGVHTVWAGLNPRRAMGGKNENVTRRTAVLIDVDYHHKDTPATDEEVNLALRDAERIVNHLKAKGHPAPYVDVSGNGVHIILMVELPKNPDYTDKVKEFYRTLPVKVDPKNADLARMCRVTGTYNLKANRLSYTVAPGEWDRDETLERYLTAESNLDKVVESPSTNGAYSKRVLQYKSKARPCILAMLTNENAGARGGSGDLDHEAHLLIVKDAQYNGLGYEEICSLFNQQPDYNRGVTERMVTAAMQDNMAKGVTPWFCNNLIERRWCIEPNPKNCRAIKPDPDKPKKEHTKKDDKGTELIKLAQEYAVEFFRDQFKVVYVTIHRDPGNSVGTLPVYSIPIASRDFKRWIARLYYDKTQSTASNEAINAAILVLEAEAQLKPVRTMYNRVAPAGELAYWWDMGDDTGRAIHISRDGWEIVDSPPQIFWRYDHMKPLPTPIRGGSLQPLMKYFIIDSAGNKLLIVVTAIDYIIFGHPHPLLLVTGQHGIGKTAIQLLVQELIDPSILDILAMPTKDEDLTQVLEKHYLCAFDNVGQVTKSQQDIICRTITGVGIEKRQLFTTNESYITNYKHCTGLNSITIPVDNPDILSRSIILPWLAPKKKLDEDIVEGWRIADAPGLIGAMLDVLVKAIQLYPTTETSLDTRLAAYARWGCSITLALGLKQTDFEQAYRENIEYQHEEAVHASMVAELIIQYMDTFNKNTLTGSANELKELLEEWKNPNNEYGRPTGNPLSRRESWPKNSVRFGRALSEVAPSMKELGYTVTTPKGNLGKDRRKYTITLTAATETATKPGQQNLGAAAPTGLTDAQLEYALTGTHQ